MESRFTEDSMGFNGVGLLLLFLGAQVVSTAQAFHLPATNLTLSVSPPESPPSHFEFLGRTAVIIRRDKTNAPVFFRGTALGDQGWLRDIRWVDENTGQVLATIGVLGGHWIGGGPYTRPTACHFDIRLDQPVQCPEGFYTISMSARDDAGRSVTNSMSFEVLTLKTALEELTTAAAQTITNSAGEKILSPLQRARIALERDRFRLVAAHVRRFQRRMNTYENLSGDVWFSLSYSADRIFEATHKK